MSDISTNLFSLVQHAAKLSGEQFCQIKSTTDGRMDLKDLEAVVSFAKRIGIESLVILATLGTTFKGACDDIVAINDIITHPMLFPREAVHIHIDAALHGGFYHHSSKKQDYLLGRDFDSFSVSGHKWYGGFIGGCFFTHLNTDDTVKVDYLGFEDKVASGSRDALIAPMWHARLNQFDWKQEYRRCRSNMRYLEQRLQEYSIPSFSHSISVITMFPKPSQVICDRFQLATLDGWAHACVMPHMTKEIIDMFLDHMRKTGDLEEMKHKKYDLDPDTEWPI